MEVVVIEVGVYCPVTVLQGVNEFCAHRTCSGDVLWLICNGERTIFENGRGDVATIVSSLVGTWQTGQISEREETAEERRHTKQDHTGVWYW